MDVRRFASAPAADLYSTPGEWDPPKGVVPKRDVLYLSIGIPDSATLPRADLAHAMQAVLDRPDDAALRYGFGPGYFPLRQWLAGHRNATDALTVTPDWFHLLNGSSGAIDLIARSLLDPGDVVVSEDPAYIGTLHNFRGAQARVVPAAMDEEGLDPDAVRAAIERVHADGGRVKLVYCISAFQNPTGRTLASERRRALVEVAEEHDVVILEDEAYRELAFDGATVPSLLAEAIDLGVPHRVISTGTFSKTIATGLRVGWLLAHPDWLALMERMRFDLSNNQIAPRMLAEYLKGDAYGTHLGAMRALYWQKMTTLAEALEQGGAAEFMEYPRPTGGFYLWAKLRGGLTADAVWRTAMHEGLQVNSGTGFFIDKANRPGEYLRLVYPWTPLKDLPAAAERLLTACRRVAAGDSA